MRIPMPKCDFNKEIKKPTEPLEKKLQQTFRLIMQKTNYFQRGLIFIIYK